MMLDLVCLVNKQGVKGPQGSGKALTWVYKGSSMVEILIFLRGFKHLLWAHHTGICCSVDWATVKGKTHYRDMESQLSSG